MIDSGEDCRFYPFQPQSEDSQREQSRCIGQKWVGDNLGRGKKIGDMRVVFMNIRGVGNGNMTHALKKFREWNSDYLGLVDTKMDGFLATGLKMAVETHWSERNEGRTTKPKYNIVESYKGLKGRVGGIYCAIQEGIGRRAHKVISDPRGWSRWAGFKLQGKRRNELAIISVYGPTPTQNSEGSVWSQQKRMMEELRNEGERMEADPRKQFLRDLSKEISEIHIDGVQVVLGGDLNITEHELADWAESLGLENFLGEVTQYHPTYIRNECTQTCIDHVFVTRGLIEEGFMSGAGIYTEILWGSDHVALIVDIEIEHVLKITERDTQKARVRSKQFTSSSKLMVEKFQQQMTQEWRERRITDRIKDLTKGRSCQEYAECTTWHRPSEGWELELVNVLREMTEVTVKVGDRITQSIPVGRKKFVNRHFVKVHIDTLGDFEKLIKN